MTNGHPQPPRIGSLCTGYGGLDLAVLAVLGGHVVWVADNDPAASRLLRARWPGAPNLGDIATVDWYRVPPVDVLTCGWPCQDLSHAGKRAGITGPRSGLWRHVAVAVRDVRPGLVFLENVAGLRTRGLDVVDQLHSRLTRRRSIDPPDLHVPDNVRPQRHDAPSGGPTVQITASATTPTLPTPCARDGKGPGHQRGLPDLIQPGGSLLPTPTARTYGSNRSPSAGAARRPGLARQLPPAPAVAESRSSTDATAARITPARGHPSGTRLLPTPRVSDARGPGGHGAGGPDLRTTVTFLPTPRGSDGVKGSPTQRGSHGDLTLPAAAVAVGGDHPPAEASDHTHQGHPPTGTVSDIDWGPYTDAVTRWRRILGRPSPAATQPGRHGRPVLAPDWVEWLMGLPDGWVTGLDLPRTVALRLLGNGVVPQQAAAALRALLILHAQQPAGRP